MVFLFHSFMNCQFSFPTALPPMSFHEQTLGIPFTTVLAGRGVATGQGPYYFMPRLYLDDPWVLMVGRNFWGFDKELASVSVTNRSYAVTSSKGRGLVSLEWTDNGETETQPAIGGYPEFGAVRQMLSQPLISFSPVGIGPILTLTDFERSWNLGTVRRLQSVLKVDPRYVRGFDGGRFEAGSERENNKSTMCGSYEISAPWWLGYPYFPPGSVFAYPTSAAMRGLR